MKRFFGPNIVERIEQERRKSVKWKVEWNGGARHEVYFDDLVFHAREAHVVMLASHSCTCGKWDHKSDIICQHALAAATFQGEDPFEYVSERFTRMYT